VNLQGTRRLVHGFGSALQRASAPFDPRAEGLRGWTPPPNRGTDHPDPEGHAPKPVGFES
jgi:hypothetical protein